MLTKSTVQQYDPVFHVHYHWLHQNILLDVHWNLSEELLPHFHNGNNNLALKSIIFHHIVTALLRK